MKGILHADRCTHKITSRWILLTMKNVSDKSCRGTQNTRFVSNNIFPENSAIYEIITPRSSPSWKANRFSASQEIPRILWNLEVHCRIYNSPPPVPILSQLDSAHTLTSHFLKIHLNITLPPTPGSSKRSLSLKFPQQNIVYASLLPHTPYMPRLSHSSRFDHPTNIWWAVQIIKLPIM